MCSFLAGKVLLEHLAQAEDLLVFFKQHGKHEDLEWQGMRGKLGGSQVLPRTGEQVIQGQLVGAAQGTAEAGKGGLLLQEGLGGRRKGASHISSPFRRAAAGGGAGGPAGARSPHPPKPAAVQAFSRPHGWAQPGGARCAQRPRGSSAA